MDILTQLKYVVIIVEYFCDICNYFTSRSEYLCVA
jgi:hypothetical protein